MLTEVPYRMVCAQDIGLGVSLVLICVWFSEHQALAAGIAALGFIASAAGVSLSNRFME